MAEDRRGHDFVAHEGMRGGSRFGRWDGPPPRGDGVLGLARSAARPAAAARGARAWAAPTGKGDGSCVRRDGRAAGMIGWALTAEFCVKGAFSENEYNGFYHLRENENVK